jgi:hypothetical protein
MLWIVPAKVAGTWRLPQGELTLTQKFQILSGTLGQTPIANGKLRGDQVTFEAGNSRYTGRVSGDAIDGTMTSGGSTSSFKASRIRR